MTSERFPLAAAYLTLALALAGCATTRPGGPAVADTSETDAEAPSAVLEGTRVVATGPVLPRPEGPVPLRVPAQVMRVWIAPWEDCRGDLHAPGYLYTEIEPRRWTLGAPAEGAGETLIRPLQIERRDGEAGETSRPKTGADPAPALPPTAPAQRAPAPKAPPPPNAFAS